MRTLATVASVFLVGAGVAAAVIWVQEFGKQRAREAELAAQRVERGRLASCVVDKASDSALREVLIAQYQPQGILFKHHQEQWDGRCAELTRQLASNDERTRQKIQLQHMITCISEPDQLSRGREVQPNSFRLSDLLSPLLKACDIRAPSGRVIPEYMTYYTFVSIDLMEQARARAIYDALMTEDKAIMGPFEETKAKRIEEQEAKRAKESDWLFKK